MGHLNDLWRQKEVSSDCQYIKSNMELKLYALYVTWHIEILCMRTEEEKGADGVTQEKETCPKQEPHVVYIKIWVLSTNRILSVIRHINHSA